MIKWLVELRHHEAFNHLKSYKQINNAIGTAVAIKALSISEWIKPAHFTPNINDLFYFEIKKGHFYPFRRTRSNVAIVNGWCNRVIKSLPDGLTLKEKLLKEITNE